MAAHRVIFMTDTQWHMATKMHMVASFFEEFSMCQFLSSYGKTHSNVKRQLKDIQRFFEKYLIFHKFQEMLKDTRRHTM